MKALKITGSIIGGLLLLLIIIGMALPRAGSIQQSIVIGSSPAKVYKQLNSFENFHKWSPWLVADSTAQYVLEGPLAGIGSKIQWSSKNNEVQKASQWIINTHKNKRVNFKVDYGDLGNYFSDFNIEKQDEKTKLTWIYKYENLGMIEAFIMNIFGTPKGLEKKHIQGLENLKNYMESLPVEDTDQAMQVVKTDAITFIGLSGTVTHESDSAGRAVIENLYTQLMDYMQTAETEIKGMPLVLYSKADGDNNTNVICGIPVEEGTLIDDEVIEIGRISGGEAVKYTYKGHYENLPDIHAEIERFIGKNGYKLNGAPYEIFVSEPDTGTTESVTHIFYPVLQNASAAIE